MARIKNIEEFCPNCGVVTKMELAGEVSGADAEGKRWAKCKKCKQKMIINYSDAVKEPKFTSEGIEKEDATTYSPKKTFTVGESIYHENFDDFGRVINKQILSSGKSSIGVEFEKSGFKKLIESL
jgi:hypothetical protein